MNAGQSVTILLALAIGLGVGAVILIWRCCPLRVFGARATGTVERLIPRRVMVQDVPGAVPHPVSVHEAVIVFTTRSGEAIHFQSSIHGAGARAPGDRVPVCYNAARPTEAEIETPSRPLQAAFFLAALSALLFVAATVAGS